MSMRTTVVGIMTAALTLSALASDIDTLNIECRLETISSTNFRSLDLVFYKTCPPSDKTEELLRTFLQASSSLYSDRDIIAKAWSNPTGRELDEKSIPLKDGSTALFYRSATKTIQTDNQSSGVQSKTSSNTQQNYSVKYEEQTFPQPIGKAASLQVAFNSATKEDDIYLVLVDELQKALSSQSPKLKTTVYAYTGDLANPAGMKQIMGSDGIYIVVECNPSDGNIVRKDLRTRQKRTLGTLKR